MTMIARATTYQDRAEWLAARKQGIGASEAAAILGLSPYQSPLEVYLRKIGDMPEQEETWAMKAGTALEPLLSSEYRRRYSARLHEQPFMKHREHPWMFATLDGITEDGIVVEFKTAGWRQAHDWGDEDTDAVPTQYLVQVQHQLAVADAELGHIFVSIDRDDPKRFIVRRNPDLIAILIGREKLFWEHVCDRTPPVDFGIRADDARIMHLLHPEASGAIRLADEDLLIVDAWIAAKEARGLKEKTVDELRAQILQAMGPFAWATLPDGRTLTRKVIAVEAQTVERKAYSYTDLRIRKARP